ncbi:unnamed protein product, partial [Staurois parvus]
VAACCPRPLPSGKLPPVARGPCPGVDCRLLPEAPAQWSVAACCPRPLPRGRLPPVARGPCLVSPIRCPVTEGARLRPQA